jgi:hypothetical protein
LDLDDRLGLAELGRQPLGFSRKPTLWTYEMICYYFTGLAEEDELLAHLAKLQQQDSPAWTRGPPPLRPRQRSPLRGSRLPALALGRTARFRCMSHRHASRLLAIGPPQRNNRAEQDWGGSLFGVE